MPVDDIAEALDKAIEKAVKLNNEANCLEEAIRKAGIDFTDDYCFKVAMRMHQALQRQRLASSRYFLKRMKERKANAARAE
jgi:hypothetical protein